MLDLANSVGSLDSVFAKVAGHDLGYNEIISRGLGVHFDLDAILGSQLFVVQEPLDLGFGKRVHGAQELG